MSCVHSSVATKTVADRSIAACLREAAVRLNTTSDSSRLDAELLLSSILHLSRTQLRTREPQVLSAEQARAFDQAVSRRENGEPIAYILGEKEFWSLPLQVTPAVLVPRPETELLVEWALECLKQAHAPALADLGTGSGAIALALARERPDAHIVAVDSSAAALEIARANAESLRFAHVEFRQSDWFSACAEDRFDLVVSNPPYVCRDDDHLKNLRHEPRSALVSGADGLDAIRQLVRHAPEYLRIGGWLLLEHGATQATAVRALMTERGYSNIATRRDLAGLERATGARWSIPA